MRRIARTARASATATAWLLVATGLAGCAAVRPFPIASVTEVPTDFSYLAGRATQTFKGTIPTLQPAVLAALDDLRVATIRQHNDSGTLVFEGTTADNRGASVLLRPHAGGATKVVVRVGLFGDEALSRALMDRVAIRLGALPPSAIPVDPPSTPGANPYFSRTAVSDAEMLKDRADALNRGADAP